MCAKILTLPNNGEAPPKPKKHVRAHNEGTIFQRKDGRWVARIVVGTLPSGKPDKREIYCRTKADAVEALKTLHKEINQRQDHRGGEPFESFLMRWLDKSKLAKVRQNTWELYAGDIENHIIPDLGATPIADIETSQIQTLMDKNDRERLFVQCFIQSPLYYRFLPAYGTARQNY